MSPAESAEAEQMQLRRLSAAFFCLLTANFQMSPVRDALGLSLGHNDAALLVVASAATTVFTSPLVGRITRSRAGTAAVVGWFYRRCALGLCAYWAALAWTDGDSRSRAGYLVASSFIVLSNTVNLFAMSLLWGFAADCFAPSQAKRLFGSLSGACTAGQAFGSVLAWAALAGGLPPSALLLAAASALVAAAHFVRAPERGVVGGGGDSVVCGGGNSAEGGAEGGGAEGENESGTPLALRVALCDRYVLLLGAYTLLYTGTMSLIYLERTPNVVSPQNQAHSRIHSSRGVRAECC